MTNAQTQNHVGGIVIITCDGPEHRFVANSIAAHYKVEAVLICEPTPRRSWRKFMFQFPWRFLDKVFWRLFLTAAGDANSRRKALKQVLGEEIDTFTVRNIEYVGRPKDGRLERKVCELSPEILVIYGTSIIPEEVLKLSRVITLNMHTGISPYYRGAACSFWPIHNCEPNLVGATVHECTSNIDGGRIFATKEAKLYRDDYSLHHVFARSVLAGTGAYIEVLDAALTGRLSGEPQDLSIGREYRGSERGLRSELVARWNLKSLRREWPKLA